MARITNIATLAASKGQWTNHIGGIASRQDAGVHADLICAPMGFVASNEYIMEISMIPAK